MESSNRNVGSDAKQAALTLLGKRLRTARENAGLTQQAVAKQLKVSAQSVRNWEIGKHEPTRTAKDTLAALYVVQLEQLTADILGLQPKKPHSRPNKRIEVAPQLLAQARKDARLSQAQVSGRTGVNIASIRRYERGAARPTRATLRRLAITYGKPTSWLDPDAADAPQVTEAPHMDEAMRTCLKVQPDLSPCSVMTIKDFILFTHLQQMKTGQKQIACAPEQQMAF